MTQTLAATPDVAAATVGLALTWTTPTAPATASIQRVNLVTGEIADVRDAAPATLTAGAWSGTDYEAPLDEPVYYLATSTDQPTAAITTASLTLDSGGSTWLKHPGRPWLNTAVHAADGPGLSRPIPRGVFDVLGRTRPVAVSLLRSSERGELHLTTLTDDERVALLALLADGTPLLLSTPAGYGVGNAYISVGDVVENRVSPLGAEPARAWSLPFIAVDRPAGSALPPPVTYAALHTADPTYRDVLAAELTYQGILDGLG